MRALLVFLSLFLISCTTSKLPDNWAPITTLVEREGLPGVSNNIVTTVSPYLFVPDIDSFWSYYPPGGLEHEALRRHEVVHAKSQESYPGGKVAWLTKYSTNSEFRWEEEKKGYKESISFLVKSRRWWLWRTEEEAKSLSGPAYLHMTTYGKAKLWIEQIVMDAR